MPTARPARKTALKRADALKLDALPNLEVRVDPVAIDRAQDSVYDAFDAKSQASAIKHALKALTISPHCADAYVLLASYQAKDEDERIALYRHAMKAAEKVLGPEGFEEFAPHFWGFLETRPYMRARHGLALTLAAKGLHAEAAEHYRGMLALNPGDNQGVRYLLIDLLLLLGLLEEAEELLGQYDEGMAAWLWSKALLAFKKSGDHETSRKALKHAIASNKHILPLLTGAMAMPRSLPAYISIGDETEAVGYVYGAFGAWRATEGAIAWAAVNSVGGRQARKSKPAKKKPASRLN